MTLIIYNERERLTVGMCTLIICFYITSAASSKLSVSVHIIINNNRHCINALWETLCGQVTPLMHQGLRFSVMSRDILTFRQESGGTDKQTTKSGFIVFCKLTCQLHHKILMWILMWLWCDRHSEQWFTVHAHSCLGKVCTETLAQK